MHTGRRSCGQKDRDWANGHPSPGRPRVASKPSEAGEAGAASLAAPEGTNCAHTLLSDWGLQSCEAESACRAPRPGVVLYYSSPGELIQSPL